MREPARSAPIFPAAAAVSLAILAFINGLCVLKYAPRTGISPWAALAGYLVFLAAQSFFLGAWAHRLRRGSWGIRILVGGTVAYAVLAFAVYARTNPGSLQLDRWSALQRFWDALFHGEYPYSPLSHLGNPISGFPGLFLMALPFYALGDVGLLQFAALAAFAIFVAVRFRGGLPVFLIGLLMGMPAFGYEVFARSDLFANMLAVCALLRLSSRWRGATGGRFFLLAALWGLALSTRAVVFVPLLLALFPLLHDRPRLSSLLFVIVTAGVFLGTFLPFYLWDAGLFRIHNPFHVQSVYIPGWGLAVLGAACCFLGYRSRIRPRLNLHTGLLLFATVFMCGVLSALHYGWGESLWGNRFNVSYFVLPLPFLLLALGESLSGNETGFVPTDRSASGTRVT